MSDFTFNCPYCSQSLEVTEDMLGQLIDCPSCGGSIQLPEPNPKPAQIEHSPSAVGPKKKIILNRSKSSTSTKDCPFCGENILQTAQKCRYCGEFLRGKRAVETNVKQGALIGAFASFLIGILFMFFSLWSFAIYTPIFLAAFILSIMAMSQKRIVGGLLALLLTLIVPPITFFALTALRGEKAAKELAKSVQEVEEEFASAFDKAEYKNVVAQIADLEARQSSAAKSELILKRIAVTGAQFYWSNSDFLSEPVIDCYVRNQTGQALSRLFFRGTLSSPGRTIPWVDDDFNYTILGGLENGEEKHLKLSPNSFSDWGNRELKERSDLQFKITVINAADASGQKLVEEFGAYEAERLQKLRAQKTELDAKLDK